MAQITREPGMFEAGILSWGKELPEMDSAPSAKHHTLLYSACLYSNPYSNAGEKLRTLAIHSEHQIQE